jgi:diguanylate cyclase (GGDEF)-like protein
VRAFGWRALIGATVQVAGRTYFLLFGSAQPAGEPFTQEDCAYVDVLASFFASRLQHGIQRDRIREQLEIDTLTGLPNRATFRRAAMQTMSEGACAMIVIDVDGWRRVIDLHGHQTADALLVELAATFGTLAGPGEPVARLTGDTFAMLVRVADVSALHERVRNFVTTLSRPYSIGDRFGREHVSLTVCAGLALAQPGNTFELLFRNAEAALSAAKQAGSGSMAAFDDVMEASHAQRQLVRLELPNAVACGHLDVIYQPMIVLSTMRVCGADALVRWNHPEHGVIRAADFLPFAWENGVKANIGRLVMNAVVAALPVLSDDRAFRAYINVSAQELSDPVFLSDLRVLVRKQQAGRLGVEIAESVVMRDAQSAIAILEKLKGDGLAIAMDDFGTGRASIADLKRVPLDVIKIDGSLIRGLPHDRDSVLIVEALLNVAQTFGYTTIAKNVETAEQLAWLAAHNCTMAQGYHVAHPMSAPAFRAWAATVRDSPAVA